MIFVERSCGTCAYEYPGYSRRCHECMFDSRDLPGWKPKTENLKGEEKMPETRKTKTELLEELAELKKEIERVEQRKQFETAAQALKDQCDALIEVGFTHDAAFELLKTIVMAAGKVG